MSEEGVAAGPRLALSGVTRQFKQAEGAIDVLRGVDLTLTAGAMVALVGPSGAGKSTLLQICGLLEQPTDGQVRINGTDAGRLDDRARTRLRRTEIGFVYQFHHLLPEFSAQENLVIPQLIAGRARKEALARANELLALVGLTERAKHRPARLSGGEQQRVAIARALVNGPSLLLADEPTGNLDPETAEGVFDLLRQLVRGAGLAALVATHNRDLAHRMDRVVELQGGVLRDAARPAAGAGQQVTSAL